MTTFLWWLFVTQYPHTSTFSTVAIMKMSLNIKKNCLFSEWKGWNVRSCIHVLKSIWFSDFRQSVPDFIPRGYIILSSEFIFVRSENFKRYVSERSKNVHFTCITGKILALKAKRTSNLTARENLCDNILLTVGTSCKKAIHLIS